MADLDIQIATSNSAALSGIRNLNAQLKGLQTTATALTGALNNNTSATTASTAAMGRLGNSGRHAAGGFNQARGALDQFNRGIGQFKALIAGGLVLRLGSDIQDTALKMKGAENAMTALTGSAVLGEAKMKRLAEIADEVGYRNTDLVKSYVKLQGAVAGTTLEGEASDKLFRNLARATALYGGTTDDLDGSLQALTQMASKGTVQMEELKGQLGDRLPGALRIAADAMGVTTKELSKMVKDGKLDADTFFRKFGDELGTKIPASFENARGGIARFQNQWDKAKVAFADSGFMNGLATAMGGLTTKIKEATDNGTLGRFGKAIGDILTFIGQNIGVISAFVAALAALNIAGSIATSIVSLSGAFTVLRTATLAASASMITLEAAMAFLTGPWGIAILAIAAAVGALALAQQKTVQPTKDVKTATEALDKALDGYKDTANLAAEATGKDRKALLDSLAAKKLAIEHERALAQAKLNTAQATLTAAEAQIRTAQTSMYGTGGTAEAANMGAANAGTRVANQAQANIDALTTSIGKAKKGIADIDATIKALNAPKVDLGGGGGGDGKGAKKAARDAAAATKKYTDELEKLKAAADAATLSERDQAAMTALDSAGLKQNIKATDARSVAIIAAARAAYDAKQAVEDKKAVDELDIDTTKRLVQAQNDLLALTNPALAASQQAIASANDEYAATIKKIDALKALTDAEREAAKAKAVAARDAQINAANEDKKKSENAYGRDITRGAEDAEIDARGITDPKGAEEERQRVAIERERTDKLRELGENVDKDTQAYRDMEAAINQTADNELSNLDKTIKQTKVVDTIKGMSDLFGNLFTSPKQAMKQFFSQMISQLLQTIAYALIMKTTMASAFSAMGGGGGGIAGKIVGSVLGARAHGGPVVGNGSYLVGEDGPEILKMGSGGGTIIPNGAIGGAGGGGFSMGDLNTHITVNNGQGMNPQQLSVSIVEQQRRMLENIVDQRIRKGR